MDRYDGKENRALRILILVFILIVLTILGIGYGLYVHSDPVIRREFTGLGVMLTGAIAAAIILSWRESRLRTYYEQVAITKALHESDTRWQFALEGSDDGLWDRNAQTNQVFYSRQWKAMLGFAADEIGDSPDEWQKRIHPDDVAQVMAQIEQHLAAQTPVYTNEYRLRCKDGTYKWVLDRGKVISWDENKNPLRVIGTHTDVTGHKQLAIHLQEAQERLLEAQQLAHIGNWEWDLQKGTLLWSDEVYRIFGVTPGEFAPSGAAFESYIHPEDKESFLRQRQQMLDEKHVALIEHRIILPDGQIRHVQERTQVKLDDTGNVMRVIGTVQDITERREMEIIIVGKQQALEATVQQLVSSHNMLQSIIETIPVRVFWKDRDLRYLGCNQLFARDAGFNKPEEIVGKDDFALIWHEQAPLYQQDDRTVMRSRQPKTNIVEPQTTPEGNIIWLNTSKVPLQNPAGEVMGVLGVYEDISVRKQMEESLRQNEGLLREAQRIGRMGHVEWTAPDRQLICSDELYAILELPPTTALSPKVIAEMIHPEDRDYLQQMDRRLFAQRMDINYEYRVILASGRERWLHQQGKVTYREDGQPIRMLAVIQDITERKQVEEALRESENRAQAMLKAIPDLMFRLDRQGVFLDYKADIQELYAQTEAPLIGKRNRDVAPAEFADLIEQKIAATLENGGVQTFEYQLDIPGRGWRDYEARMAPSGEEEVLAIVRDITDHKLALDALRKSEERFRSAFDNMLEGTQILDFEWRYLYLNTTAERHNHRPNAELSGNVYMDCWPGIETTHVFTVLKQCMEERVGNHLENEFVFPDGTVRWFELSIQPIPEGIFILSVDITERKRAEAELRQSEELYRGLMESLDSVVATVDKDGRFLYMNDRAAAQLNGVPSDFIGKTMYDLFPEPVASRQLTSIQRAIHEDRSVISEAQTFVQGQYRWNRTTIQPIHDEAGKVMFALVNSTDIDNLKQIQQELEELNHTLEKRVQERTAEVVDLYDHAPTGYHSVDPNGMFLMMNQTELDWLGYHRDEVLGQKSFRDLVAPSSHLLLNSIFTQFKRDGLAKDIEFEMVRKDGTILPVLLNATAIYNEQGEFVQSRSTLFDITERRKAEKALRESQASLQNFLDTASDLIQRTDQDGRYIYVNPAWCQTLGYGLEEALELTMFDVIAPQYHDRCQIILGRLPLKGQSHDFEVVFVTKTGQVVVAEGGVSIDRESNGQITTNGIFRDITLRKQAEEALRQSRDELRTANDLLEKAARLKDEFLANMSHELRTPLNAILTFSESLLEEIPGPLNDRQKNWIHNIEGSGMHLLSLINDILDLSKVEAGQMELHFEEVAVVEVCQASLLFVKEMALKKKLKLAFQLDNQLAKVEADPKRLKQILVNLLSNAVKFTPSGGKVSLEVRVDGDTSVIHYVVQDTGVGIAAADVARLFQPFTQLDSSLSRQHEGTGLGLALVRRLTELHGGSVTVESKPGDGSRFTVTLPYRPVMALTKKLDTGQLNPFQEKATVLVVEDVPSAAAQLVHYLQEMKIEAVVQSQGVMVVEQAMRLQPTAILLDLLMPDRSGWDILADLKAEPQTRAIPVLIVSVVDERSRGLAAGAAAYLVKPISREMLRQALGRIAAAKNGPHPTLPEPKPAGAHILLAEDNEINVLAIADFLKSRNYQITVAKNGREVIELIHTIHPDLVLMDIQMPEMDGLEAIRRLRARPDFATIPIIALTALAMPGDRERCLAAGANEYLTKPVSLKGLATLIQLLLTPDDQGSETQ